MRTPRSVLLILHQPQVFGKVSLLPITFLAAAMVYDGVFGAQVLASEPYCMRVRHRYGQQQRTTLLEEMGSKASSIQTVQHNVHRTSTVPLAKTVLGGIAQ